MCLECILRQQSTFDSRKSQVIVVANGCADETLSKIDLVRSTRSDLFVQFEFVMIVAGAIGKSNSLQLALDRATGRFIAIIDDDNYLSDNWSSIVWETCTSSEFLGILGTSSMLPFETNINLKGELREYLKHYAVGIFPDNEIRSTVWGAGCVFDYNIWRVLRENDFKFLLSGRRGTRLIAGEDSEFCLAASMFGFKATTTSKAVLVHDIAPVRLNREYLLRLLYSEGYAHVTLELYKLVIRKTRISVLSFSTELQKQLFSSFFKMIVFAILSFSKPDNLRHVSKFAFYKGVFFGVVGSSLRFYEILNSLVRLSSMRQYEKSET
jgi:glycosyltransferase involved in cell wall biosynthesis